MVESKFQTSFIPKKPIESTPSGRRQAPSLLRLIAILILILSLALWGGVFLWKTYLNNQIQGDQTSLANSEKEFDATTVTTLTRLDNRLTSAESLLDNHISTSKLFDELQSITLKNIRFSDFSLAYGGTSGITLNLKGEALSYADVASQSDVFDQDQNFKNPIFSNLNLDSDGHVSFSVTTTLDPKDYLYTNGANVGGTTAATTTTTSNPFNQ